MLIGQPTVNEKWDQLPETTKNQLYEKAVFVEPLEMFHVMKGRNTKPEIIDLRSDFHFNQFHIIDSQHYQEYQLFTPTKLRSLKTAPNSVFFLITDDEKIASRVWKNLNKNHFFCSQYFISPI